MPNLYIKLHQRDVCIGDNIVCMGFGAIQVSGIRWGSWDISPATEGGGGQLQFFLPLEAFPCNAVQCSQRAVYMGTHGPNLYPSMQHRAGCSADLAVFTLRG